MKVLVKGMMPNKTKIQIEDRRDGEAFHIHAATIVAYPTDRKGKKIIARKRCGTYYEAAFIFYLLTKGMATLDDCGFRTIYAGRSIPYQEKM